MLFLGVIRYEQYYDELVAYGDFPPFGALRHHLSPAVRGHNKAPYNIPLICGSKVSTGCCPTACGGKVVAQPPKGERISSRRRRGLPVFPRAKPGCKGFIHTGAAGAHLHPLNLLNLLNPYARQGVSLKPQTPVGIRHSTLPGRRAASVFASKKMEPCVMHSSIILHPMKAIIPP
jgi:hypothetical protein